MIRLLKKEDYFKYYKLINQFRKTDFLYNNFCNFLNEKNINVWIIEKNNEIIGSCTILYERKLIHNYGLVAHLEDVVICENYKNKGLGSLLLSEIIKKIKEKNCYKIILNCNEEIKGFYEKNNFIVNGLEMKYNLT